MQAPGVQNKWESGQDNAPITKKHTNNTKNTAKHTQTIHTIFYNKQKTRCTLLLTPVDDDFIEGVKRLRGLVVSDDPRRQPHPKGDLHPAAHDSSHFLLHRLVLEGAEETHRSQVEAEVRGNRSLRRPPGEIKKKTHMTSFGRVDTKRDWSK